MMPQNSDQQQENANR